MPYSVIDRVNKLGKGQPEHLIFADRNGNTIGDVDLPGVDGPSTRFEDHEPAPMEQLVTPSPLGDTNLEINTPPIEQDEPEQPTIQPEQMLPQQEQPAETETQQPVAPPPAPNLPEVTDGQRDLQESLSSRQQLSNLQHPWITQFRSQECGVRREFERCRRITFPA